MIDLKFTGQLGARVFEYVAARSAAERLTRPVSLKPMRKLAATFFLISVVAYPGLSSARGGLHSQPSTADCRYEEAQAKARASGQPTDSATHWVGFHFIRLWHKLNNSCAAAERKYQAAKVGAPAQ